MSDFGKSVGFGFGIRHIPSCHASHGVDSIASYNGKSTAPLTGRIWAPGQ